MLLLSTLTLNPLFSQDEDRPLLRSQEVTGNGRQAAVGRKAEESQITVIHTNDPVYRTKINSYVRGIRSSLRHRLGLFDNDEWRIKLRIEMLGSTQDVHSGNDIKMVGEFDEANQMRLRMYVKLHDRFKEKKFRTAFIRMLLVEQMLEVYLDNPNLFQEGEVRPPDWMVHGFDYHLRHRELGKPSYFFSGYLKNNQLMPVGEILKPNRAEGLTPVSLELFRASSAILVEALCDQKHGSESMRGLLADFVVKSESPADNLIRKNFPGFRETGQGLDKWWALQLAILAQQQSFEYFTADATDRYLGQAIEVKLKAKPTAEAKRISSKAGAQLFGKIKASSNAFRNKKEFSEDFDGSIHDYRQFLNHPQTKSVIKHRMRSLATLRVNCFPVYRPLIDQYMGICQKILSGKTEGIDRQLQAMKQRRATIKQTLAQTKDYLNYYEATRLPKRSKAFDSYLEFKKQMQENPLPKRDDPISRAMDESDRYFGD